MAGGVKARVERLRRRWPLLDHLIAMIEHYGKVQGSLLAGAVTYFGFLSFFPLIAIGFSVVGYISGAYPDARDHLVTAIEQIFPNIVSENGGGSTISLHQIEQHATTAGVIGLAGLLYAGLGWLSGLRNALETAFEVPSKEQPNFIVGKVIDIGALVLLGLILVLSVGIAGVVEAAADSILDAVGLDNSAVGQPLIWSVGAILGVVASTLLFFTMYKVLGRPELPSRVLWQGALFAALCFEALKVIVVNILGRVGGTSIASLAIAVTLVVWINYFSRITVFGASWAMTATAARRSADRPSERLEQIAVVDAIAVVEPSHGAAPRRGVLARFDAGSAIIGGVIGAVVAAALGRSGD
jgi:membrane protein